MANQSGIISPLNRYWRAANIAAYQEAVQDGLDTRRQLELLSALGISEEEAKKSVLEATISDTSLSRDKMEKLTRFFAKDRCV